MSTRKEVFFEKQMKKQIEEIKKLTEALVVSPSERQSTEIVPVEKTEIAVVQTVDALIFEPLPGNGDLEQAKILIESLLKKSNTIIKICVNLNSDGKSELVGGAIEEKKVKLRALVEKIGDNRIQPIVLMNGWKDKNKIPAAHRYHIIPSAHRLIKVRKGVADLNYLFGLLLEFSKKCLDSKSLEVSLQSELGRPVERGELLQAVKSGGVVSCKTGKKDKAKKYEGVMDLVSSSGYTDNYTLKFTEQSSKETSEISFSYAAPSIDVEYHDGQYAISANMPQLSESKTNKILGVKNRLRKENADTNKLSIVMYTSENNPVNPLNIHQDALIKAVEGMEDVEVKIIQGDLKKEDVEVVDNVSKVQSIFPQEKFWEACFFADLLLATGDSTMVEQWLLGYENVMLYSAPTHKQHVESSVNAWVKNASFLGEDAAYLTYAKDSVDIDKQAEVLKKVIEFVKAYKVFKNGKLEEKHPMSQDCKNYQSFLETMTNAMNTSCLPQNTPKPK